MLFVPLPDFSLSEEAKKSLREQIPYIDERIQAVAFRDGGIELRIEQAEMDAEQLIHQVCALAKKTHQSYAKVTLIKHFETPGLGSETRDPHRALQESGQVTETAPGVFVFQGAFLTLLQDLDRFLLQDMREQGALELQCPSVLPAQALLSNGYLSGFPQHAFLVSSIRYELSAVEQAGRSDLVEVAGLLDTPSLSLSPTVCYHCFEALRSKKVPIDGILYTAWGHCHRHEERNIQGLRRLQSYTMRELIMYGSPDFVERTRQQNMRRIQEWMTDWGVRCRMVTATDPFFALGAERKRNYQSLMRLKYELQFYIPHADEWLSVASFNHHQKTLVDAYQIESEDGQPVASGCIGYGFERFAYALACQFGLDWNAWPSSLQQALSLKTSEVCLAQ